MRLTPRVAGFRSEYPAGFKLECMAGFIGTRTLDDAAQNYILLRRKQGARSRPSSQHHFERLPRPRPDGGDWHRI